MSKNKSEEIFEIWWKVAKIMGVISEEESQAKMAVYAMQSKKKKIIQWKGWLLSIIYDLYDLYI